MKTHLLSGKVVHRRSRPKRYELEHDVWYLALDLDELDQLDNLGRWSRLVRRNARALVAFYDRDYLPVPARDVSADIRIHLNDSGIDLTGGRITLVTNPRVLGYQFNPASFYLCTSDSGDLACVVVEVHNTHGERHLYTLLPQRSGERVFSARMNKEFYVSPFIGPDGDYRVSVRWAEDGSLAIGINERDLGEPLLATSLNLRPLPLTRRNLVSRLVRYPLVSHKTIALIHWHAFRLWLKGIAFHRHSPQTAVAVQSAREGAVQSASSTAATPLPR